LEVEFVKGLQMDTVSPVRERLPAEALTSANNNTIGFRQSM